MQVPILRQGNYLIASIQSALEDGDLVKLRDSLSAQVGVARARGVIVDVTALDIMDSFATRTLSELAAIIRLRGAEMVIVGIQPEVAVALARLGLSLAGVTTVLDLEEGIAYLDSQVSGVGKENMRRG